MMMGGEALSDDFPQSADKCCVPRRGQALAQEVESQLVLLPFFAPLQGQQKVWP